MKWRLRDRRGSSVVEFAMVLPLLLILVSGIIEFGLILYDKVVITNASREGARYGIVVQSPSVTAAQITGVVNNYCSTYLVSATNNSPVTTVTNAGGAFQTLLKVQVTYNYGFFVLPNLVKSLTGPIVLSATTSMNME